MTFALPGLLGKAFGYVGEKNIRPIMRRSYLCLQNATATSRVNPV